MIKFLETEEISACIKRIIKNAEKTLIIVSPYLKIRPRLKSYFEEAISRNVQVIFVYRNGNFHQDDEDWFKQLGKGVVRIENKDLHAKCYLNDYEAVVTSMNFYEYSQDNNYEMGFLLDKGEPMFAQIEKSVGTIINHAIQSEANKKEIGVCIRCRTEIELNPNKPYCYSCYLIWAEYENYDYRESVCHNCAKPEETTMNKPLCYDCYRNDHKILE